MRSKKRGHISRRQSSRGSGFKSSIVKAVRESPSPCLEAMAHTGVMCPDYIQRRASCTNYYITHGEKAGQAHREKYPSLTRNTYLRFLFAPLSMFAVRLPSLRMYWKGDSVMCLIVSYFSTLWKRMHLYDRKMILRKQWPQILQSEHNNLFGDFIIRKFPAIKLPSQRSVPITIDVLVVKIFETIFVKWCTTTRTVPTNFISFLTISTTNFTISFFLSSVHEFS